MRSASVNGGRAAGPGAPTGQAAAAFEALAAPHLSDLLAFCRYLTKSSWDAEDLFQEALTKAFVYFRNSERRALTKSFLFGAARLLWIDAYRKRKRSGHPELRAEEPQDAEYDADYIEIRGMLEWVAERLSTRHMEIWMLAEYFGYSLQDIAERMDSTVPAVKSVLHRTKQLLRSQRPARAAAAQAGAAERATVDRWVDAVLYDEPLRMPI